jgi:hypothetical protein
MATTKRTTAVVVFGDRAQAQQAVAELRRAGFRDDQIGVVTQKHDEHGAAPGKDAGTKAAEGAGIGVAAGAGIGALWALGIAAAIFPPLGVVAGGTLMAVLASAATGAAVAGLTGALVGLGVPEHEAKYYEGEVKAGRTLVTVRADDRYDEAFTTLRRAGGYDQANRGQAGTETKAGTGPKMARQV